MSRPPLARERVLDAFERILIEDGERTATMDATARAAGVSKGGLLYHFASKEALEAALLERLSVLVDDDIAALAAAPEGAIAFFVRTSVTNDGDIDRAIVATARLAQGGSQAAAAALHDARERWQDAMRPHTRDQAALDLVMLVSDGLYFNNVLQGEGAAASVPTGAALDALVALVEASARPEAPARGPADPATAP